METKYALSTEDDLTAAVSTNDCVIITACTCNFYAEGEINPAGFLTITNARVGFL